jgi:hypothetical protein
MILRLAGLARQRFLEPVSAGPLSLRSRWHSFLGKTLLRGFSNCGTRPKGAYKEHRQGRSGPPLNAGLASSCLTRSIHGPTVFAFFVSAAGGQFVLLGTGHADSGLRNMMDNVFRWVCGPGRWGGRQAVPPVQTPPETNSDKWRPCMHTCHAAGRCHGTLDLCITLHYKHSTSTESTGHCTGACADAPCADAATGVQPSKLAGLGLTPGAP